MLWAICGIFLVLWLAMMASASTFGGLVHLLLLAALALLLMANRKGRHVL